VSNNSQPANEPSILGKFATYEEMLDEVIFDLANPLLNRPLSPNSAQEYLARLETSTIVR
jgi:hypothetical protein